MDVVEDVKKSPDDGEGIVPSLFALVMVLPKAVADIPNDGVPSMMLSLLLCPPPETHSKKSLTNTNHQIYRH